MCSSDLKLSHPIQTQTRRTQIGHKLHAETGLYYYRARYYDPANGRFINEDPVGFKAGQNFYAYVGRVPRVPVWHLGLLTSAPSFRFAPPASSRLAPQPTVRTIHTLSRSKQTVYKY